MKNKFQLVVSIAALLAVGLACNMSTANMSSFKVGKDKAVTQESAAFKAGDTIYGVATISNAPGKTTVKFFLSADEVANMTKGEMLKGTNVDVAVPDGGGTAMYSLPIPAGVAGGKYILTADMHNEAGEKKDGKTVAITIEAGKAPAPTPETSDDSEDDTANSDDSN